MTVSRGALYYTFPVLALPITADTGWPLAATTAVFSLAQVTGALVGIPMGRLLDRSGPRLAMTVGAAVAVPALVGIALAPNLWVFTAAWVVAGATTATLFYTPAFAALTHWYGPTLVRALTLLTLAAGLASTIFAPLAAALDDQVGWRGTYLVLALVMALIVVPLHAFALRTRWSGSTAPTSRNGAAPTGDGRADVAGRRVMRSTAFVALTTALALGGFGMYAVPVNLIPLLDERGLDANTAAWVLGAGGIGQMVGRLGYGPLNRCTRAVTRSCLVLVVGALTIALLAVVSGPVAALFAVSVLAGVGRGLFILLQATAVSDRWGTARYGTLNGVVHAPATTAIALTSGAGTLLAAALGGYPALFVLLAAVTLVGAVLLLLSRPRRRQRALPAAPRPKADHRDAVTEQQ